MGNIANVKITRDVINLLAPEHAKTSCNDDTKVNDFRHDNGYAECIRCYLLDNEGLTIDELDINLTVNQSPKYVERVIKQRSPVGMDKWEDIR